MGETLAKLSCTSCTWRGVMFVVLVRSMDGLAEELVHVHAALEVRVVDRLRQLRDVRLVRAEAGERAAERFDEPLVERELRLDLHFCVSLVSLDGRAIATPVPSIWSR